MLRPATLNKQPGMGTMMLGGMAASILLGALILLARHYGLFDLPVLIGGIFTGHETAAFHLGFWLFFAGGVLVFAPLMGSLWSVLPGNNTGMLGALIKGLLGGVGVWIITGLLLPLLAALNAFDSPAVSEVGFFAISRGAVAIAWLATATIAYGVSVALIAGMTYGVMPIEVLGWEGYVPGEQQKEGIF